jgi:3,4-dihydroxy 2-butanone 4-phosphate synthase/GTP cyclohydrolase II
MVAAARGIGPDTVTLMVREARGLVCHAMTAAHLLEAGLPLIPATRPVPGAWRYAVSYEAARGCSTGISAADRAQSLNAAAAAALAPGDLGTPGHVMPVLGDPDAAEARHHAPSAALRLLRAAGIGGGAAICTILAADGQVATVEDAAAMVRRLGLDAVPADAVSVWAAA